MRIIPIFTILLVALVTSVSYAKDRVDYDAMKKEGFGDIADIYKNMTPSQKDEVYYNAKKMEAELKKMSPGELEFIRKRAKKLANEKGIKEFNPKAINTQNSKLIDTKTVTSGYVNNLTEKKEKHKIKH